MRLFRLFHTIVFISSAAISLLIASDLASGQRVDGDKALARFQKDLAKRVVKDQGVRYALIDFNQESRKPGAEPKDEKEYFRLAKRASDVDENNLKWLKKQISKFGFPDPSQIGQRSAVEFYLLILHADRDREFQKDCIGRMKDSSEWSDESVWSSRLKALERRASMRSSREFFRVEDPKKKKEKEPEKKEKPEAVEAETVEQE